MYNIVLELITGECSTLFFCLFLFFLLVIIAAKLILYCDQSFKMHKN